MKVGNLDILLGADPECFIWNKEFDRPVSAVGIIPGTKVEPFKVEKGGVQVDGLAAEFNIDPAANEDEWVENITTVLAQMNSMLPDGHEFRFEPAAFFTEEHFNKQPDEAKELGCDPDYNAWQSAQNPVPGIKMVAKGMLRTAAGHIHIGWTEGADVASPEHIAKCEILVKLMDRYIGAPMVLSKGNQEEKRRRKLYGRAGAYRPKTYGVEYRTASNNWLTSEEKMRWAYRNTILCIERMLEGERASTKYGGMYGRDLPGSINRGQNYNIHAILQEQGVFKAVPDFPASVKERGRY
jgi:hypothetical protein